MSTAKQSASALKNDLTTLNTYVDTINGEYQAYVNSHNAHTCAGNQYIDGFRPGSGHSWGEYRDEVSAVATWVKTYVDDWEWVDALDTRATKWSTATGHASDAYDDVDSKNLPAIDSWKGPAGNAYREVAPKMQGGTSSAYYGAMLMKSASTTLSESGDTFFSSVAAAISTLASSLTHYTPAPLTPQTVAAPAGSAPSYSCGLTHEFDDAGNHPWTAMTACTEALRILTLDVDSSLRVPLPGGPANGFESLSDHFTDVWPPAPGGA